MTTENIVISQGATFERTIELIANSGQPLAVAGYTANAAIRRDYYTNAVSIPFAISLANGALTLRMEANTTSTIYPGSYVYDAVLTDGTNSYRVAEGYCDVTPGVSGNNVN